VKVQLNDLNDLQVRLQASLYRLVSLLAADGKLDFASPEIVQQSSQEKRHPADYAVLVGDPLANEDFLKATAARLMSNAYYVEVEHMQAALSDMELILSTRQHLSE
jgi:hypothetical protein